MIFTSFERQFDEILLMKRLIINYFYLMLILIKGSIFFCLEKLSCIILDVFFENIFHDKVTQYLAFCTFVDLGGKVYTKQFNLH